MATAVTLVGVVAVGVMLFFAVRYFMTPFCDLDGEYGEMIISEVHESLDVYRGHINSGKFCEKIEGLEGDGLVTCEVDWIDEDDEIAFLYVHRDIGCTPRSSTGELFPHSFFEALIINNQIVKFGEWHNTNVSPQGDRGGEYFTREVSVELSDDQIATISSYLKSLDPSRSYYKFTD